MENVMNNTIISCQNFLDLQNQLIQKHARVIQGLFDKTVTDDIHQIDWSQDIVFMNAFPEIEKSQSSTFFVLSIQEDPGTE